MVTINEISDKQNQGIEKALKRDYTIHGITTIRNGLVDVDGDVIVKRPMSRLTTKFGSVSGGFSCAQSKLLTLAGSPSRCRDFNCEHNILSSLEGGPIHVDQHFICSENALKSLEGGPIYVGGSYLAARTGLISLMGAPKKVGQSFHCAENMLTTLEHGPERVGLDYYCDGNPLTSLDFLPKELRIVSVPWNKDLPLLKLVSYQYVSVDDEKVNEILGKWSSKDGSLRSRIVGCQNELIAAGFEGNAKW